MDMWGMLRTVDNNSNNNNNNNINDNNNDNNNHNNNINNNNPLSKRSHGLGICGKLQYTAKQKCQSEGFGIRVRWTCCISYPTDSHKFELFLSWGVPSVRNGSTSVCYRLVHVTSPQLSPSRMPLAISRSKCEYLVSYWLSWPVEEGGMTSFYFNHGLGLSLGAKLVSANNRPSIFSIIFRPWN